MSGIKIIKGNFYDCSHNRKLRVRSGFYCVVKDGVSQGVFREIPAEYAGAEVTDYSDKIIIPGLVDLHTHAPQYSYRGSGMDLELLDWLNTYTFPEEARYSSMEYASQAYGIFAEDLVRSATTRAVIFGTIHREATLLLMDKLETTGLVTYVGKVNMDRHAPEDCMEETEDSLKETKQFIEESGKYENTHPILTPRFIPTCSDELMRGLAGIQSETGLPVQSHLSENRSEVNWVRKLSPESRFYGDAYDSFGLFGGECRTVMAHCVFSHEKEIRLMAERGVFAAHCPNSNTNLASGIAPVRRFLNHGVRVGLGSDIAAGHSLSLFDEMISAVQVSKLYWRYLDGNCRPLRITEAFYMATRGGGEFFGKVGCFSEGYEFDALVIDDSSIRSARETDAVARLHRMIYANHECRICAKYVKGKDIFTSVH